MERQNHTLGQYLCSYINYYQGSWVTLQLLAEFAYNNSFHSSTGVTLYFASMDHCS
jgi:hypothetical protein